MLSAQVHENRGQPMLLLYKCVQQMHQNLNVANNVAK